MPILAFDAALAARSRSPWGGDFVPTGMVEIRLTAPRSSLPLGRRYALVGLGIALGLLSLRFVLLGAWPVLLFSALDLAALAVAFYLFDRGGVPEERLRIGNGMIELVRADARRRCTRVALPLFGTRIEIACRSEFDCRLWLVCRQQRHALGQCISVGERRAALPRIEAALAAARR